MYQYLMNRHRHVDVLSIAVPMILSNVTVPLLGLVDTAVIGHLEHAWSLGGVAMGGNMINVILWLFGFLRMATTGMTAQAYGANDAKKQVHILLQGVMIGAIFSVIILALSVPLSDVILNFSHASHEIKIYSREYFLIRIIGCPAALVNLVFMGWLLGTHQAKKAMWLLVLVNLMNIVLDLLFVPGFNMGVKGVAIASVIADYFGFALGIYFVSSTWLKRELAKTKIKFKELFEDVFAVLKLNLDIFLRSLFLQAVFTFMTFKGARLGDDIAAANAVLMSFLLFISYAMDGFAYTMEALVGSSLGAKDKQKLLGSLVIAGFWSLMISLLCTVLFATSGELIIDSMSSIEAVREKSYTYLPWLIIFPLISMWSFLLDGIFVGATLGREMRNGMILASAIYFISYGIFHHHGNDALWGSLLIFMAARGIILALMLKLNKHAFRDLTTA